VYDLIGKRVHISRDAIFDERACWDWDAPVQNPSSFVIDLSSPVGVTRAPAVREEPTTPTTPAHTPASAPTTSVPFMDTPPVQGSDGEGTAAEGYVSPPAGATPDSELVGEEGPRRYRTLESIVDVLDSDNTGELFLVAGEEPTSFQEAEPHAAWRAAMIDELASIEEN
jgi:hypothetical protein